MERARFWDLIEVSRQRAAAIERDPVTDFLTVHIETLTNTLRDLTPEELISFERHFRECLALAYRWDIWAAAYWLHGGCGDDGFWDFRSCLISTGQKNFDRVVANPDDLADLEEEPNIPYLQCEGFQYVAAKVYAELTGSEMPYDTANLPTVTEPQGDNFDFEDQTEMARRYPKLVAKYPEMGD